MADPVSSAIVAIKWVASAVVGSAVGGVTATGVAAVATKLAVTAAVSMAVAALATKAVNANSGQQLEFKADPLAGYDTVIGRTAVGGANVFKYPAGPNNKHLNMFAHLSGCGPVEAVESFLMNSDGVGWNNATGATTNAAYSKRLWHKLSLGALGAAALTQPTMPATDSPLPQWGVNHKLSGHAHAWVDCEYDSEVWASGITPQWVVRGVKCYDPRYDSTYPGGSGSQRVNDQDTWAYSQNPYIVGLTYCIGWRHNGTLVGGVGARPAAIDIGSFVAAANVADVNGWTCGGVFGSQEDRWDVLKRILAAGSGEPVASGALISCIVNTPRTSLGTITVEDVCGPLSIPAVKSQRERINSVIPRYRSEAHNWEVVSASPVTVAAYVTADGKLRQQELEYAYCQNAQQAAVLAAYDLVNAREFGPVALTLKPRWLGVVAGDAVTVNIPEAGLNNQLVVVRSRSIDYATGEVTLTVESETTAKHAFALGRTPAPPPQAGLTRPNFGTVAAPRAGEWTATPGSDVTGMPSIVITGTAGDLPAISDIVVEYRAGNDVPWITWGSVPASQRRIDVTGVAGLHTYGVAIRYRSIYGVVSERLVLIDVTTPALISDGADGLTDGLGNIISAEELLGDINEALEGHDRNWEELARTNLTVQSHYEIQQALSYTGDGKTVQTLALEGSNKAEDAIDRFNLLFAGLPGSSAYILNTDLVRVSPDQTMAQYMQSVTTSMGGLGTAIEETNASVQQVSTAVQEQGTVMAQYVLDLSSQVAGVESSAQLALEAVDGMKSHAYLKVQAGDQIAGIFVNADDTVGTSKIGFIAETLFISSSLDPAKAIFPFVWDGQRLRMQAVTISGGLEVDTVSAYQRGYENISLDPQAVMFGTQASINDNNNNYCNPYSNYPSGRQRFASIGTLENSADVAKPLRIAHGMRRFTVTGGASVDAYLSVWYQVFNPGTGAWGEPQYIARGVDNASGVGNVFIGYACDAQIPVGGKIQFFLSVNRGGTGSDRWDAATGTRSIVEGYVVVTSVNWS